jgi:hypothetical protein
MSEKFKNEKYDSLKRIFFSDIYSEKMYKLSFSVLSLCGYYDVENKDKEIQDELLKLNKYLLNFELLNSLTEKLNSTSGKNFQWSPHLNRNDLPQNLTLAPTFNVENIDTSKLLDLIDKIRIEINNQPVNFKILFSYIKKKAKEEGDL